MKSRALLLRAIYADREADIPGETRPAWAAMADVLGEVPEGMDALAVESEIEVAMIARDSDALLTWDGAQLLLLFGQGYTDVVLFTVPQEPVDAPAVPPYEVVAATHTVIPLLIAADTILDAVVILGRVCKADPYVTSMPYIRRGDGSALSDDESTAVDAAMADLDTDVLAPWEWITNACEDIGNNCIGNWPERQGRWDGTWGGGVCGQLHTYTCKEHDAARAVML